MTPSLFDQLPPAPRPKLTVLDGGKLRDEAIDRVKAAAPDSFLNRARGAVATAARNGQPFTTDDVWKAMADEPSPPERRAMGAIMRECQRDGMIVALPEYRPSVRPECHCNPKRVWIAAKAQEAA